MENITLKKYLETARINPLEALQILQNRPDLATAIWNGNKKWIPGSTPLHWAAHDGHLAIVKKLVELGAPINANDANWWTRPIEWAADSAQFTVVQFLLENGAQIDGDKWSNCTPLHAAAQGGSTNGRECTADYMKTTEVLINGGANINAIATYGGQPPQLTPLDDARRVGNKGVEEVLLKYGAKTSEELTST